jgi:hypothetical protein
MLENTWAKAGIDPERLLPSGPLMRGVSGPALREGPSVLAGIAHRRATRIAPHRRIDRAVGRCRFSGKQVFQPFSHQTRKQQFVGHLDHLLLRG